MKKILTLLLLSLPLTLLAEGDETPGNLSTGNFGENKKFVPRASHWVSRFGFEYINYPTIYEFDGVHKDFEIRSKKGQNYHQLFGGRVGFGRELYIGKGVMTSLRVEGYFVGSLFTNERNAGDEAATVIVDYTKDTGQLYGVDGVQTISWLYDFTVNNPLLEVKSNMVFEPFVEGGIGVASAYNKKRYHWKTRIEEDYELRVTDKLANVKFGGGFNILSQEGYFLSLRASLSQYQILERSVRGYKAPSGGPREEIREDPKSDKINPILVYSIGGGYKF